MNTNLVMYIYMYSEFNAHLFEDVSQVDTALAVLH